MSFTSNTFSLSALKPVKFTYKYNSEEKLKSNFSLYRGNFGYIKHNVFDSFKDAIISKKSCAILTDRINLDDLFETSSRTIEIGRISGCTFLKNAQGKYVTIRNDRVFVGGIGEKAFVNIIPIENNFVELRVGQTKFFQIDEEYPYTVRLSEDDLESEKLYLRRFEIEYAQGKVSFRAATKEGSRFLSYGVDSVVRAIGLELNDTVVNPCRFQAEFISNPELKYNFDPQAKEIKYFNELLASSTRSTLDIKQSGLVNTNLLVSCPTLQIAQQEVPIVNIAILKTNYSSTGTFSPSI